jgi:hypothetical protein
MKYMELVDGDHQEMELWVAALQKRLPERVPERGPDQSIGE